MTQKLLKEMQTNLSVRHQQLLQNQLEDECLKFIKIVNFVFSPANDERGTTLDFAN